MLPGEHAGILQHKSSPAESKHLGWFLNYKGQHFFPRFPLKLRENHQIPQTNTALSVSSGFQRQEEEKIGVKANLKLIKNWISVIRGVLSIILAPSEERGCQASSSLPPLAVFLFVAEPERCIWISKFVFPRKLSRVTFTEKRKRYFSEKKNPSLPGEHCLSVSSHTGFFLFQRKEKKNKEQQIF